MTTTDFWADTETGSECDLKKHGPSKGSALTQQRLKQILSYDPDTGVFTRIEVPGSRTDLLYTVAGHRDRRLGYCAIWVDTVLMRSARLAWLYVYGEHPKGVIDHIDGNPYNDRITNLRDVSTYGNAQNRSRPSKRSSTGYLGAYRYMYNGIERYRSQICVNRKIIHLGVFDTVEQAREAYVTAKRKYQSTNTL